MAKRTYYDRLAEDLPKPRFCDTWNQRACEAGIAEITENLKRPMSNDDRIAACRDRRALRERLAELIGQPS